MVSFPNQQADNKRNELPSKSSLTSLSFGRNSPDVFRTLASTYLVSLTNNGHRTGHLCFAPSQTPSQELTWTKHEPSQPRIAHSVPDASRSGLPSSRMVTCGTSSVLSDHQKLTSRPGGSTCLRNIKPASLRGADLRRAKISRWSVREQAMTHHRKPSSSSRAKLEAPSRAQDFQVAIVCVPPGRSSPVSQRTRDCCYSLETPVLEPNNFGSSAASGPN